MANILTAEDAAARVEDMSQGPVPEPGVIFHPPPGGDGPGPPVEPIGAYLGIYMYQPDGDGPISGTASQGVVILASGNVDFNKYTVARVEVRFPGTGFVPAALNPNDGWSWTATSPPIKTAGQQRVTARVIGRRKNNSNPEYSDPVNRTVEIVLTDDIPPVVTINRPTNNAVITPTPSGQYVLPLEVKVTDASGVSLVEYKTENSGWQVMPLQPSPGVWQAGPNAFVQYLPRTQVVRVRARDAKGNVGYGSVRVVTKDVTAPTVRINGDSAISLPGQGTAGAAVLPLLSGSAADSQSGIKRIEWSLDGGPFKAVDSKNVTDSLSGGKVYWWVENVAIPPGVHRIQVRATDNADKVPNTPANLSSVAELKIAVTERYRPKDPTVREYFSSLVDFIVRRLRWSGFPVTTELLGSVLFQPVQRLLATDPSLPPPQVSQLRICLEALRRYCDTVQVVGSSNEPVPGRKAAEARYRQLVYEAILRWLGTSVEELGAALRADAATRLALANRLGIELNERPGPDESLRNNLQQFLVSNDLAMNTKLERLFGLADFSRDPLEPAGNDPVLLDLQEQRLESTWKAQDRDAPGAIIDPDVITEGDLRPGSNPAAVLLRARQMWLDGLLTALRSRGGLVTVPPPFDPIPPTEDSIAAEGPVTGGSLTVDPLTHFDQIVADVLGSIGALQALETRHLSGENITPDLDRAQLTFPAFHRLMATRRLAGSTAITNADWEDVYAILIQVQKLRVLDEWREIEQGAGLHLGPSFFQLGLAERPGTALSPWRTTPGSRRRWRTTLQGRTEQQLAMRQALASAVSSAEEESLPVLRDDLMSALAKVLPASPRALAQRLLIDVMTGGAVRITRVEHAIQTLQSLIIGVRTGSLPDWSRASNVSQETFDEELRWMGSYANWYAAMQVFLYPENFLQPTLRPVEEWSGGFRTLVRGLRADRQLTPERASTLVAVAPFSIALARTRGDLLKRRNEIKAVIDQPVADALGKLRAISRDNREKYYFVPLALALALHRAGQYLAALDWFRMVYAYDLPLSDRKIYYGLVLERDPQPNRQLMYERNLFWLAETLNPHDIVDESYQSAASARYDVHTRFVVMSIVHCLLDFADSEFIQDTNESLPRARSLYLEALDLLAIPELNPAKVDELTPNDRVANLRWRAQTALAKLRTGRNVAGLKRQLEPVAPLAQTSSGLPLVVSSGPFGSSSLRAFQPTPYRYTTLIERAKNLTSIAQQVEQSYLAALEKRDAEAYNLFQAQQDLALANANAQLQALRATEAQDGVVLAERQQERATFQVAAYQGLLDTPMNNWERQLLDDYRDAREARNLFATIDAAVAAAQAVTAAASGGILGTGIGAGGPVASAAVAALAFTRANQTIELNNIEARTQEHSLQASVENRVREWTLQQGVAKKDEAISAQQFQLALDHQAIVVQEGAIAQLQFAQAQATIAFLTNKFTNVELYEWMVDVLQDVYGYFLRQATAVAQLAQNQLAFESQGSVPVFIRKDYWQPSDDTLLTGTSSPDRRGLTGSARLLQDVYQLDQFAFETNTRKLQLAKTISLARLAPAEFQQFRRTGVLTFATPMALFDEEFPGHYLRLIKRVRTSVVALVPPNQGIRATLSNPGVSRVVIGGDSFQTVRLTRDPESVALTSPSNATGVFELDAQPELLLPFELSGVDSIWNLEMPKAANPFDYRTIADVLVTIEYTALSNGEYRHKVIQQLDRSVVASRSFSVRDQLPDQWYDLHNPQQAATPLGVQVHLATEDLPPNLDTITTVHLVLYVVFSESGAQTPVRALLTFRPTGKNPGPLTGEAVSTAEGIISTRIGNAAAWVPMLNGAPFGTWRLAFPETAQMRKLFDNEAIADVVFVVTYTGRTPEWPE